MLNSAALLADDVRTTMPPWPMWFEGRRDVIRALAASWDPAAPAYVARFRTVLTGANGQPAVATYTRRRGDAEHRPFGISVLDIAGGSIINIVAFHDVDLFGAFELPDTLAPAS